MNASSLPAWVPILAALLTPTIAIVAAYIAWQQWRTNRNKLKLDLFERRYAYYEAASELIRRILTSGKATDQVTSEFIHKIRGAQFIVGEAVATYFYKQLYSNALDLNTLDDELQGLDVGPERSAIVGKRSDIKKWFSDQPEVLDDLFKPLLNLKH